MANQVEYLGSRHYIVDENHDKLRMIPEQYKNICLGITLDNTKQLYLSVRERLQMELLLYRRELQITDKYVWELIKDKSFVGCGGINVKFGDDRYEANFQGIKVVCPKLLYELAIRSLYDNYHSFSIT